MENLTNKSIIEILNEMPNDGIMNPTNAEDGIKYFSDVCTEATHILDERMNREQTSKLLILMQSAIISQEVMMDKSNAMKFMMMATDDATRSVMAMCFLAGIGMSAREEIR